MAYGLCKTKKNGLIEIQSQSSACSLIAGDSSINYFRHINNLSIHRLLFHLDSLVFVRLLKNPYFGGQSSLLLTLLKTLLNIFVITTRAGLIFRQTKLSKHM